MAQEIQSALVTHLEKLAGVKIVERMFMGQMYQLVVVAPNGDEEVVEYCLPEQRARAYEETYNHVGQRSGHVCEARPLLSCLARDADGKVHTLLAV